TLGIDLGPVFALAGVAGLALALGLQDLVENLIAGAYLLARRPFRVGDEIETNGVFGTVRDINLRTTVISLPDGSIAYLPNGSVWKNTIINQTEEGHRRSSISVGVAYDSDLDEVEELLASAARSVENVLTEPAPFAVLDEFGDSSIDFKVFFWHGSRESQERIVSHHVAKAVKRSFDEAGVNIPFPIRTIIQKSPNNPD
ncbi:MAG: mechanosensitive ion channel family protein, partial [Acidimicrobiia bacterium]|nr:mechanosensitive ion channel family protein [Acidimicrobiia bacterium]